MSNFDFGRVVNVVVDLKCLVIRPKYPTHDELLDFWYYLSDEKFNNFVYLYKKWLRSRPDPFERVAMFEALDPDGVWSLTKHEIVFKSRLTPLELVELEDFY